MVPATTTWSTAGPARSGSMEEIVYRTARSAAERREAFRLAYRIGARKGSVKANTFQLHVTPWHLLDTTTVFVGTRGHVLVGTATLIADGELHLPLDSTHPAEMQLLRCRGSRIAEVSCLAIQEIPPAQFLAFYLRLMRVIAQFARHAGLDLLVCAAAPAQLRFYTRQMGFEPLTPPGPPPSPATDTPDVVCCLDLARIEHEHPPCHGQYFGQPIPERELIAQPMCETELAALRPIAEQSSVCAVPAHALTDGAHHAGG
jgi:hypothetical protein